MQLLSNQNLPTDDIVIELQPTTDMFSQNQKEFFLEIQNVSTPIELAKITLKIKNQYPEDEELLQAVIQKQQELKRNLQAIAEKTSERVSTIPQTIHQRDITADELREKILINITPNTYSKVNISHPYEQVFRFSRLMARKIQLVREDWGFLNIGVITNSLHAFFSCLLETESFYRMAIDKNVLKKGILSSSLYEKNVIHLQSKPTDTISKEQFDQHMYIAYWTGQTIILTVPCDFSEEPIIDMTPASELLKFSIEEGKNIRFSFTPVSTDHQENQNPNQDIACSTIVENEEINMFEMQNRRNAPKQPLAEEK